MREGALYNFGALFGPGHSACHGARMIGVPLTATSCAPWSSVAPAVDSPVLEATGEGAGNISRRVLRGFEDVMNIIRHFGMGTAQA
ncbi:MAG: hypothetical protein EA417_12790 [Gammaproteobacteria bacterium]|nr:MAG: hypothetical protein EA417_12790 [Gammaproteobacteria bacterium]